MAAFSGGFLRIVLAAVLVCAGSSLVGAGETITFFHNDVAGSPMLATDVNGIQVWKETYRPFGDRLVDSAASENNEIWFAGKPYDESTGLSYMGARYYDPTLGRFMAIDPVGVDVENLHSVNRYAYANNNPYRFVDPNGESPTSIASGYAHMQDLRRTNPTEAAKVEKTGLAVIGVGASLVLPDPTDALVLGALARITPKVSNLFKGGKAASGLGDLTKAEVKQIQSVVDEAGRPLDVVGSAARGERREIGSDLPIGKGNGTRSDTDYTTASSNRGNFDGLEDGLPNADPSAPILRGTPEIGKPSIRFEPRTPPRRTDGQ